MAERHVRVWGPPFAAVQGLRESRGQGTDAVTLARQGARVTGVDFSPTALRRFHALAEQCGVEAASVESDAQNLPQDTRWLL